MHPSLALLYRSLSSPPIYVWRINGKIIGEAPLPVSVWYFLLHLLLFVLNERLQLTKVINWIPMDLDSLNSIFTKVFVHINSLA